MSNSTLMGNNRVSEAEVIAVPAVSWTKTFHPVSHGSVIRAVKEAIGLVGMAIANESYALDKSGSKFFAVYDLNHGSSGVRWSVGVRNSTNKSISFGITCGVRVLVCSNLCFEGDFISYRKHSSGLDNDELCFLAFKSMKLMIPRLQAFQRWHQILKTFSLSEFDAMILLVEILEKKVIPASKFHAYCDLYKNTYEPTLWGAHESVTDILRGSNLLTLPQKNKLLNGILDNYICSLDSANSSALGDFYESRALMRT